MVRGAREDRSAPNRARSSRLRRVRAGARGSIVSSTSPELSVVVMFAPAGHRTEKLNSRAAALALPGEASGDWRWTLALGAR
jgi:hypothetical protein